MVVERMTELYGGQGLQSALGHLAQKDPLAHLLALQRRHWPGAWVSSTFYDWRTVSKYRRKEGLHLGYDLALPFGTPVSAGWPGTVTSVVPWTTSEYGITVTSREGLSVTYGHLSPTVSVGQEIATGAVVGRVASDHVDVKMKDGLGRYVPFGEDTQQPLAVAPNVDRSTLLTAWLVAKNSVEQAEEELFLRRNASKKRALERRSAQRKIDILEQTLEELKGPQSEGLVARRTIEQFKAELGRARRKLKRINQQEGLPPEQLQRTLSASRASLGSLESWAKSQGLSWVDVENLVASTIIGDSRLGEAVRTEKQRSPNTQVLSEAELKEKRASLERLEKLYLNGGLSRQEIEEERLRLQLMEEEFQLKLRRTQH